MLFLRDALAKYTKRFQRQPTQHRKRKDPDDRARSPLRGLEWRVDDREHGGAQPGHSQRDEPPLVLEYRCCSRADWNRNEDGRHCER